MVKLIVMIDTEGTPCIEIAAAARLYPGVWLPFHKFISQNRSCFLNDAWSVYHLHGLGYETVNKRGLSDYEIRRLFIDWLKWCIIKSSALFVEFRAPEDNKAETALLKEWRIVRILNFPIF